MIRSLSLYSAGESNSDCKRAERFIFGIAKIWQVFFTSKFFCIRVMFYFRKTKKTAIIRQTNAARWFHWRPCPLNINVTITVKTVSDMTSWMTLSCMSENGPPFPLKPILLAGTCAQYSKNATAHEKRITSIRGQLEEIFISWSLRCPYQAKVMKMFDVIRRRIVQTALIVLIFSVVFATDSTFSLCFSVKAAAKIL